jgi:hypothetical protein
MRRRLVLVFAILLVTLVPLSASAATSTSQTFTGAADVTMTGGSCFDIENAEAQLANPIAAAAGVVNDAGSFDLSLSADGPFPNQVVGEFSFSGAHSEAYVIFTGALRCPSAQTFVVNGAVWQGEMVDYATGKTFALSGAGRGNALSIAFGTASVSVTFTGTAKPATGNSLPR